MKKQFRQGDVLIVSIDIIPTTKNKRTLKTYNDRLLVTGEHSNHAHYATGKCEVIDVENEIYLTSREEFQIEHLLIDSGIWTKEHKPVPIPPGNYIVVRQTEYNPYQKAIKYVED